MKSDSTIFFKEYMEVVESFVLEEEQLKFLKMILKYGLGDEKITVEKVPQKYKPAFIAVKSTIDKTTERYLSMKRSRSEAGRKGMEARWGNKKSYTEEEEQNFMTIISGWNALQLTQVKKLTEERKENITELLKSYTIENFQKAFEEIRASEFLRGHNPDLWQISFDWLIRDDQNFTKVFEGSYKTREANNNDQELNRIWNPQS